MQPIPTLRTINQHPILQQNSAASTEEENKPSSLRTKANLENLQWCHPRQWDDKTLPQQHPSPYTAHTDARNYRSTPDSASELCSKYRVREQAIKLEKQGSSRKLTAISPPTMGRQKAPPQQHTSPYSQYQYSELSINPRCCIRTLRQIQRKRTNHQAWKTRLISKTYSDVTADNGTKSTMHHNNTPRLTTLQPIPMPGTIDQHPILQQNSAASTE